MNTQLFSTTINRLSTIVIHTSLTKNPKYIHHQEFLLKMEKIVLLLFVLALILGQTNATITCSIDVIPKVITCQGFILGPDTKPSQECCVGLQD